MAFFFGLTAFSPPTARKYPKR